MIGFRTALTVCLFAVTCTVTFTFMDWFIDLPILKIKKLGK